MFEDKRFNNKENENDNNNNNNIHGPKRFFNDDNLGLNDGSDNLNFNMEHTYVPEPVPITLRPKPKKDYKNVKIALLVIVILIFISALILGAINLFSSPLNVVKKYMEEGYVFASDYLNDLNSKQLNYDVNKDTLTNSGTLRINSNIPIVKDFNNYNYGYKLNVDIANKEVDGNINIRGVSGDILNSDIYIRDNQILYNDSKIYSKILVIDNIEDDIFNELRSNVDYNDVINLLKCSKDYILNNMDKRNSAKDKTTIKINGENLNVKSFSYTYSKEELKSLVKGIKDALANDNNAIQSLSDILGYSKNDVKKLLESLEIGAFDKELKITVYTTGMANVFKGFSLFYGEDELVSFGMINGVKELNINYEAFSLNVILKEDKTELTILGDNEEILSATITKNEDIRSISYQSNYLGMELKGMLEIELKRVGDKRQTFKVVNVLSLTLEEEVYELEFEINNMVQVGNKITNLSNKEIVNYDALAKLEQLIIIDNFEKTLKLTPFYNLYEIIKMKGLNN